MDLLTVKEVASMLNISQRHVYELSNPRNKAGDLREDPLPFYKLGKSVRFDRAEVQAWLSLHKSSHNSISHSAIPSNSAPVNQL